MKNFFSIQRLVRSFGYAIKGLLHVLATQANMQIHALAIVVTTFAGLYFQISRGEWIVQTIAITIVIAAELFNTAIEQMMDLLHPERDVKAGLIKDISAGGVLVAAIGAVVVAVFIYGERIVGFFV